MRIAITVISWLALAAVVAWLWAANGRETGLMALAGIGIGMFLNFLYYKVGELQMRVEALERGNLLERLHKVERKVWS